MFAPPDPVPVPPAPPDTGSPPVDLSPRPFRFTGTAGDYFRIWIVNLLLSVVTLGLYSAWAKVRRQRYFYGHTSLDGQAFGYHASPVTIFKGRLVAYAVVIGLAVLGRVSPLVASALYFPLLVLMPLVFVRALRFRAANSSYGGIRFAFGGSEADAYRVFLVLPMLVPFTLGLAYPYLTKRQREYIVGESRHGASRLALDLPTGAVYRIYLLAGLGLLAWFSVALATFVGAAGAAGIRDPQTRPGTSVLVGIALLYAGIGVLVVAVKTAFENLAWNHTRLGAHRFDSRLRGGRMVWIYASNLAAIAVTLGMAVPWARIRLAHYRADSLTLLPGGPLVAVAMAGSAEDSAAGAELSEAMDFDFGL